MANTTRPSVRNVSADRATNGGADREPDPRAARTTGALGRALVALLEERAFDAITVQDILDRASVGRTAFYAHYRNKHDVLFSSYEGMLATFDGLVDRPSPFGAPGSRLFPVGEFLAHVGDARRLVRALARDGLLGDVWAMLAGEATRVIARRLDSWSADVPDAWRPGGPGPAAPPPALLAPMLAGALVESVRWWQDHPGAATPAEVDAAFHQLARGVLRRRAGA
jgi:AcrR family transcriptional regulator